MKNKTKLHLIIVVLISQATVILSNSVFAQRTDDSWRWCYPTDPITYCIDASSASWSKVIDTAAARFSRATDWNLNKVTNCDDARIVFKFRNRTVGELLKEDNHVGQFAHFEEGTQTEFGVIKPCLVKGEVVIFRNIDWTKNDSLNCAMHELGHALGLSDITDKSSIMHLNNQKNKHTLSKEDTLAANRAAALNKLDQKHLMIPPQGGALAEKGIIVSIPAGALLDSTYIGIRYLSENSIPAGAGIPNTFDRIVAAAQISPEWKIGEIEVGELFVLKEVELSKNISIAFKINEEDLKQHASMPGHLESDLTLKKIDSNTLTLTYFNKETNVFEPLDNVIRKDLSLEISTMKMGYFAVLGKEVKPLDDTDKKGKNSPWMYFIIGSGLVLIIIGLLYRKK